MKKTYRKPEIKEKKIKLNFFLSNIAWIDDGFTLTGDIYAQTSSNCTTCSSCNCGTCGGGGGSCNCSGNSGSGGVCGGS